MKILAAAKSIVLASPRVVSLATGGAHLLRVPQDALMPNLMLMAIGSGQGYSHQGPDGLWDAMVRIYSRTGSDKASSDLGDAVVKQLERWVGPSGGLRVQLVQHLNQNMDYTDDLKIFRQIDDFRFHYWTD